MNEKVPKETYREWHETPSNWRWGVFYFNKEDKRLFPPKRSYTGWTINFANPMSILAMAGLITLILIFVSLLGRFFLRDISINE
ncbi:MAG: DUF5808 domain-containing protein [Saprospiraceae bacterium]